MKFEYYVLPVGHFQKFHSIKVFSGYTTSSTLMALCVTLTDLTEWSLIKISIKKTKFRSRRRQKSFSSKIFQNLFSYSDNFPFIRAQASKVVILVVTGVILVMVVTGVILVMAVIPTDFVLVYRAPLHRPDPELSRSQLSTSPRDVTIQVEVSLSVIC